MVDRLFNVPPFKKAFLEIKKFIKFPSPGSKSHLENNLPPRYNVPWVGEVYYLYVYIYDVVH